MSEGSETTQSSAKKGLSYKQAGVDTKKAARLVGDIGELRDQTEGERKLYGAFGLFAAGFDLSDYKSPVIFSACDGVGTKIEPLIEHQLLEYAGADLVAMNVNDILTTGADPLVFLDYIGIPKIEEKQILSLIKGITDALEDCNCVLAGGETAEMPGLVPEGAIELAGFCVGAAEKDQVLDPSKVSAGDQVIGFPSAGFHANGWSLIRRVIEENPGDFSEEDIKDLLVPTRLYHDVVNNFREAHIRPRAWAHITGGGIPENFERVLPELGADLQIPRWENDLEQKVLQHVDPEDAPHTFNMGIGWMAVVTPDHAENALSLPNAIHLGEISEQEGIRLEIKS